MNKEIKPSPFLKWAGGKHQLLPKIKMLIPTKYNNYIEPFVGGGAVVFAISPKKAIINDLNTALINTYKRISHNPTQVMRYLQDYDNILPIQGKEYYYKLRAVFNSKLLANKYDYQTAALMIFLNKHCFNGLYRVNSKGMFNVPYNNSVRSSYERDKILAVSEYMAGSDIKILNQDFEAVCSLAKQGDFVFMDSPYAPLNEKSFVSYTAAGFGLEDHKRLAKIYRKLDAKGCFLMLTNHNTPLINELYIGFKKKTVGVKRIINCDATKRSGEEIIITNY